MPLLVAARDVVSFSSVKLEARILSHPHHSSISVIFCYFAAFSFFLSLNSSRFQFLSVSVSRIEVIRWKSFKAVHYLIVSVVPLNSLTTDKSVALGFRIELEFRNVGFLGEEKTGVHRDKPLGARREPSTNSSKI